MTSVGQNGETVPSTESPPSDYRVTLRGEFATTDGGKTSLFGAKLYLHIGRPDLAQDVESRASVRFGLLVTGSVIGGLGLATVLGAIVIRYTSPERPLDPTRPADSLISGPEAIATIAGFGGIVVAVPFILAWWLLDTDPTSADERERAVDEFNRQHAWVPSGVLIAWQPPAARGSRAASQGIRLAWSW